MAAAVAPNPAPPPSADALRAEVDSLRTQLALARASRDLHHAVLLTHPATTSRLRRALPPSSSTSSADTTPSTTTSRALRACAAQRRHAASLTARIATGGATAFAVRDPDPRAPDGGRVLGVRIDVGTAGGTFAPSYYLLFRRAVGPAAGEGDGGGGEADTAEDAEAGREAETEARSLATANLRLHKHTIPPAVPLQDLLARHLPPPHTARAQDLRALVRAVRRELAAWHKRRDAVAALRVAAGLADSADADEDGGADASAARKGRRGRRTVGRGGLVGVEADGAVREVLLKWGDGMAARAKIGRDGRVEGAAAREPEGGGAGERRGRVERAMVGGDGRVEGMVERVLGVL